MNLEEFERVFVQEVGENPKTKDLDRFAKKLVREGIDVSFLKTIVLEQQKYHSIYFGVSIWERNTLEEKFVWIDDNLDLLQDWWHVDQLVKYLGNDVTFSYVYEKAKNYVNDERPFVRRLGYVLFIPRLVKTREQVEQLLALLHNDEAYYVVMAEAWLLSFMAMADSQGVYSYLSSCTLAYHIVSKAIQKICDSYVFSVEEKERFRGLRKSRRAYETNIS